MGIVVDVKVEVMVGYVLVEFVGGKGTRVG